MTTAQDIVAGLRQKSAERREAEHQAYLARAAENRRLMPQVTQWVDEMREVFGADCTVAYASEGGRTIGKPSERGINLTETCAHGRCEKNVEKDVDTIHQSDKIRPVPAINHRRKK